MHTQQTIFQKSIIAMRLWLALPAFRRGASLL
jgi:hypothetical protein